MSESITVRGAAISDNNSAQQIIALLNQVLADLDYIKTTYNSHSHPAISSPPSQTMTAPPNLLP